MAWVCAVLAAAVPPVTRAADPQPYEVTVAPTGNDTLDDVLRESAVLISLRDSAPTGPFGLIQRARLDQDRFRAVLQGLGFYRGQVTITIDGRPIDDPDLVGHLDDVPAGRSVPVAVLVATGPMFHLGRVVVDGAVPPEARDVLKLETGAKAVASDILAAQGRLLASLRAAGHPLARVDLPPATLHPDAGRLDVTFVVDPGPKAPLGAISISGLEMVRESFVRQRLLLRPNQAFSPAAIEDARADLMALGVFSTVGIEAGQHLAPDGSLPIQVTVTERKRHLVELGASYATDLGTGLNASWQHRNLFGNAEQLTLSGAFRFGGSAAIRPSYDVTARFVKPDFLRRDQALDVKATALQRSLKAYDQTAMIATATISRKLSPHWTVGLGLLGEIAEITQEGMRDTYHLLGLPVTVRYDNTDNPFDATRGIRATVSVTPMQALGTNPGTFVVTQATGSTYVDLSGDGRSVIALRGLVGQASGVGVFGLPPDQRFYGGGAGTVRGFRFQSIGPRFPSGRPTGGTAVAAGTLEFRQRVYQEFGVVAFVDAGQVNDNGLPFRGDWSVGAGVGVRYHTPIGPLRLDFAVPVNRRSGDDRFQFYIGLGQAF